jgi:hypothetical protein
MTKLTLIKGDRARLEMDIMLKLAEPRVLSEQEYQALLEPLKPRAQLSVVEHPGTGLNGKPDGRDG